MRPLDFLREELLNVERALRDTLRYDYRPEQGHEYYAECSTRLAEIRQAIGLLKPDDLSSIRARLTELLELSSWILLIERSHLGEFSWPFADELRRMALTLFKETDLKGESIEPLIHVVAEAETYQIVYEPQIPSASARRPFIVIAFQRSLKHHPLFHAVFGHELGHKALQASATSGPLYSGVIAPFTAKGPMADEASMNAWACDPNAPAALKKGLAEYHAQNSAKFCFTEDDRQAWLMEFTCDFIGLLLFGPAFFAALQTLLLPYERTAYSIDLDAPTHPPYAIRHKMLTQMMRIQGWDVPITDTKSALVHQYETKFLMEVMCDPYLAWAQVYDDQQLSDAITGAQNIFPPEECLAYERGAQTVIETLVHRLAKRLPPIHVGLTDDGKPQLFRVAISQMLYAGWVYWTGQSTSKAENNLSFFEINRLCDMALLQQSAINDMIESGIE